MLSDLYYEASPDTQRRLMKTCNYFNINTEVEFFSGCLLRLQKLLQQEKVEPELTDIKALMLFKILNYYESL